MKKSYEHTTVERRIRSAVKQMPCRWSTVRETANRVGIRDEEPAPIDLADMATYLETLKADLEQIIDQHRAEEQRLGQQLGQLQSDLAAFRRVLGIIPNRA
jgi:hypothetical protein